MKLSKIQILRDAIVKVTQILVKKDIQVTQYGTAAYVERDDNGIAQVVNLPFIPDNASDELLAAVQGFVDHEVSHILYSDGKSARDAKAKGKTIENLYGYFNDAHAERRMRENFRGSNRNLNELATFYTENRLSKKWDELKENDANQKELLGSMMSAVTRAWANDPFYQTFMHDKWDDMKEVLEKVPQSFINKVKKVSSSEDALNLTQEFLKYIETDDEPEPDDGDGEDGDGNSANQPKKQPPKSKPKKKKKEESDGDDDSDDGGKDDDSDEEDKGDKGDGDNSDDDDSDDEEESDGDQSGDGDDDSDEEGDDDSDDDGDSDGDGSDESGGDNEVDEDERQQGGNVGGDTSFSDSLESAVSDREDDVLNDQISRSLTESPNVYVPATTEFDKFIPVQPISKSDKGRYRADNYGEDILEFENEQVRELHEKAVVDVGAASKQFEKAFMAQNRTFYEPGKRSGRINPSSLFKLKTGDTRVFRKKVEVRAKNSAVSLVIDQSGSMSGGKIANAAIAAFALAEILERIKVPFEIVGFTTGNFPRHFYDKLQDLRDAFEKQTGRPHFSREDVVTMYEYKGFEERFEYAQKTRLAAAYANCVRMGANIDGESIMYAAHRLAQQDVERRCMIVLSDGQPAGGGDMRELHTHLIKSVKDIENSGIDVVGLGIASDAVQKYYSRNIVFHNPNEIAERVLGELSRMLLPGQ